MTNTIPSVTHIALRVKELRQSEEYYCRLFGLVTGFREALTVKGWCSLPEGKTWEDAERAGIELKLSVVYRGSFVLALDAQEKINEEGRLSHIGLQMTDEWLNWIRQTAQELECRIVLDEDEVVIFHDANDVLWECSTFPYVSETSQRPMSSGESSNQWLDL